MIRSCGRCGLCCASGPTLCIRARPCRRASSTGKREDENNQKCGNKYMSWAFVEADNLGKRYDDNCRRWCDRKKAKTSPVVATKAMACKLAKAAWHVMASDKDYDASRMFPELAA